MINVVKVYNKGVRPIVFKRDLTGVDCIHPGKCLTFNPKIAEKIIAKFENACSEEDYAKHLQELAERKAKEEKEAKSQAKEKTKTSVNK